MEDYIQNLIDDLRHCQHSLRVISDIQPKHAPNAKGVLREMANLLGVHISHLQQIADYDKRPHDEP